MDQDALYTKAVRLREILNDLSPSSEAAQTLLAAIGPLLERAISREVSAPLERHMPGGHMVWVEESLRDFPELEEAYAQFQNEILGGR
ncbi:hypothetical protein DyAD56_15280 [Dyella sp. AD56]|nr:hypothetical protein DyAD56_15280 [Dyella sp. AD56]